MLKGHIFVERGGAEVSADRVCDRLEVELGKHTTGVERHGNVLRFRAGVFATFQSWKPLLPFHRGILVVAKSVAGCGWPIR